MSVLGTLLLEAGLAVALAAAFIAVLHYFAQPSHTAWNEPLSHWIVALRSPSSAVRDSALGAIEHLEPANPEMVAVLSPLLEDPDTNIRIRASAMLISMSEAGVDRAVFVERAMLRVLTSGRTGPARVQAALVLGKMRATQRSTPALTRALGDAEADVRAAAAFALGEGSAAPVQDAMRALLRAMHDPIAEVRAAAMESLRREWPQNDSVLDVAGAALDDSSGIVREQALHALAEFGARARRFRPQLLVASHDSNSNIRTAARTALERMPPVP